MAIKAATLAFESTRVNENGHRVPSSKVYTFASAATNDFTEPINLEGAKCVWVSTVAVEAAEFWLINYTGKEAILDNATAWKRMSPSKAVSGAAYGFDVVNPSTEGAGFIGGSNLPAYVSVKLTGGTSTVITMHITY